MDESQMGFVRSVKRVGSSRTQGHDESDLLWVGFHFVMGRCWGLQYAHLVPR